MKEKKDVYFTLIEAITKAKEEGKSDWAILSIARNVVETLSEESYFRDLEEGEVAWTQETS